MLCPPLCPTWAPGFWLRCSETASSDPSDLGDSAPQVVLWSPIPIPASQKCVQTLIPCSAQPSPARPATELIFKTPLFLFLGGQVAKLFQDSSLGNIVNILVTRLILLTEDQVSWALLSLSCGCTSLQELCVPSGCQSQEFSLVFSILPMSPEDWAEEISGNLIFFP